MTHDGERVISGIAVSPGICQGRIVVLGDGPEQVERRSIAEGEAEAELLRLQHALIQTRQELAEIQSRVDESMGSKAAEIFEAHQMILDDPVLLDEVTRRVRSEHVNVESALRDVATQYLTSIEAVGDEYLRERAADIRDVVNRIVTNLAGRARHGEMPALREPAIIVARDLSPSRTAQLDRKLVLGFATDIGSRTSHTAILARSLDLPALVGLKNASGTLTTGQAALLDGFNGLLIINPTDRTLFQYGQIVRRRADLSEKLRDIRAKPAVTLDGVKIPLLANIEGAAEMDAVRESGAEGVGLFRTEYLFINRSSMPTEEEQFEEYRKVAEALAPDPVVIRTLDIGGDKFLSQIEIPREMNPFLGWRAIRYCLQERAVFRDQVRAILRAAKFGNVRLMYPMVSSLPELIEANAFVEACAAELRREGVPHNDTLEIGVMIEVPSAALIADALAKRVKFFSIGTNDLAQYTLAVDRLNERIAHLYEPTHPGILRLIKMTVDAAQRHGIRVDVCGEMAGDPVYAPLLVGLGVDELSVASPQLPAIKFMLRRLKMDEARKLAAFALEAEEGAVVQERAQQLAREVAPSLFETGRGG